MNVIFSIILAPYKLYKWIIYKSNMHTYEQWARQKIKTGNADEVVMDYLRSNPGDISYRQQANINKYLTCNIVDKINGKFIEAKPSSIVRKRK